MKKNLFEINSGEVQRILSLHESRTKSQYLTEAVTSFNLTKKIDIKSTGGDDNGEKNSLRLPMGTTFTVKNVGNLISNLVTYEMVNVNSSPQNVVGMGSGQIRYSCNTRRFKITDKNMSFQNYSSGGNWSDVQLFTKNLNNLCAYGDSDTFRTAETTKAANDAKAKAAEGFETNKKNSLAALKNYPCLNVTNGLQYVYATNGLHFYQNANFRYRGRGVKQATSIPMKSDGNLSNDGWEPFTCEAEFPAGTTTTGTTTTGTTTTDATNTQQVKTQQKQTQQVNRQKQFTQNTVAAINNVQKTLGVAPTGQLKNSDIDSLLTKLQ